MSVIARGSFLVRGTLGRCRGGVNRVRREFCVAVAIFCDLFFRLAPLWRNASQIAAMAAT